MAKYENSPPPSDYEDDDTPIFFTYPRPQSVVVNPPFISIDRSLIHPSLLGLKKEKNSENFIECNTNEISQDTDQNITKSVNVKKVDVSENDNAILVALSDKNLASKKVDEVKNGAQGEAENFSEVEDKSPKKLKEDEHPLPGEKNGNTNEISQDTDKNITKSVNVKKVDVSENDIAILVALLDKNLASKKVDEVKNGAQGEAENFSKVEDKSPKKLKEDKHPLPGEKNGNTNEISQDTDKYIMKSVNVKKVDVSENDNAILVALSDKNLASKKVDEVKNGAQGEAENFSEVEDKSPKKLKEDEHPLPGEKNGN